MKELKALINEQQTIVTFDGDEIEILATIAEPVDLAKGQLLFREQDAGDSVYLVISGAIDLFTNLNENLEQTIMTVRTGGFVGALAMIEDEIRDINARAAEETKAYRFNRDKLHSLITDEHGLGVKLLRLLNDILSKRLRIVINSLRQNLDWTLQVSGLAVLDIGQLIVDRVNIVVDLVNGKQLCGIIMKAEKHPSGFELFLKTNEGNVHFIPYHAIVSASLPVDAIKTDPNESTSM